LLKVEALEAQEGNGVLRIVEEKSELATAKPFGERVGQMSGESVRQDIERAKRRVERVEIFDLLVKRPIGLRVELADGAAEKNFDEKGQEIEIGLGRRETKGIDGEAGGFEAYPQVRAAKQPRETFETSAKVKNESEGIVFLEIRNQKIQEKGFAAAGAAENHGVSDVAIVKIQKVGRAVVGFEYSEVLLPELVVARFARVQREHKRQVSVIGVEKIKVAKVEGVVAGHSGKKRIQQVVALFSWVLEREYRTRPFVSLDKR